MARANIDLSWLASLLTKTPTAANSQNPAYGATEQEYEPSYNWQTGKTDDIPSEYFSPSGSSIDPSIVQKNGTTSPFTSPSKWQRLVHPEQANEIDHMNSAFITKPLMANLENKTALDVRAGNVRLLDPSLRPNISALSAAAANYGSLDTSPSYINQQNQALLTAQHGVPGIRASTDINTAKYQNTASAGALERQPGEQSILNQDQVNQLHTVYGLTPAQIDLAEQQVRASSHFLPTENSIKQQALKNQMEEQTSLIPAQTTLAKTQTGNQQLTADEQRRMWPYAKEALDNQMIGQAATSKYIPLQEPRGASIDSSTGTVTPFTRNPLGASQYESMMSMMNDINGKDTQTIIGPDGKRMTVKMPNTLHAPFDPLGNASLPPSGSPMLRKSGDDLLGVDDQSGSMAPTVNPSLSSTTLPETHAPSVNAPLSTTASTYNTGMNQAGEQYQKEHAVSNSLNTVLSKYGGNTDMKTYLAKSAPFNYNPDPDKVLDFISMNAKHMSKDDLKVALSLLHQLQ